MELRKKAAQGTVCALSLIAGVLSTDVALAQAPAAASDLEVTGYVDTYYQINMNEQPIVRLRTFDTSTNEFNLQLAEVSVKKKVGALKGQIDLATGNQAMVYNLATGAGGGGSPIIMQGFVKYTPETMSELTVTVGKFYTWMGLEVTKSKDNWNYSRSTTFNYGIPLWNQGLSAGYQITPGLLSATVYVVNEYQGAVNTNRSNVFGLNVNVTPIEGLVVNYNLFSGNETSTVSSSEGGKMVHDVNATYKISDMFSVAADVTIGSHKNGALEAGALKDATWLGWAVYGKATVMPDLNIALRYESFDDKEGAAGTGQIQKLDGITATVGYAVTANLETRLEYRTDKSDKQPFLDKDGAPKDNQSTLTAALLASF